jgi:hypothetical protein
MAGQGRALWFLVEFGQIISISRTQEDRRKEFQDIFPGFPPCWFTMAMFPPEVIVPALDFSRSLVLSSFP